MIYCEFAASGFVVITRQPIETQMTFQNFMFC